MNRKLSLAILALTLLTGCRKDPTASPISPTVEPLPVPSMVDVYQARMEQLDPEKATLLLEQIIADAEDPEECASAQLTLAQIEWRVYDKPDDARRRLSELVEQGMRQAESLIALSRMEIALHDYAAARDAASRALELAETQWDTRRARVHYAWAIVEEATLARLEADVATIATNDPQNSKLLQEALTILRDIVETEPGELQPAQLLLTAALLLDDGDSALLAWRAYYWIVPGEEAFGLLVEPYAALQELLPRWQGPESPAQDRERLVYALADSRFFTQAALVALDPRVNGALSDEITEIVFYARFIHSLQESIEAYYRQSIIEGATTWPMDIFHQEIAVFCDEFVDCKGGALTHVYEYLGDRFGAMWQWSIADGRSFHMGHTIVDEERMIEQYDQTATFRYVELDSLVSHGIHSWALDELYFVGGLADRNKIVEFRPFRVDLLLDLAPLAAIPVLGLLTSCLHATSAKE